MRIPSEVLRQQDEYQSLLRKCVNLVRSDAFIGYAKNIHTGIDYKQIITRLEKSCDELKTNRANLLEYYFTCAQINTELLLNIGIAIASESTEMTTKLPILKQISFVLDHLVIGTLVMGDFIARNLGKLIPERKVKSESKHQAWIMLAKFYKDTIELSLAELKAVASEIKSKHGYGDHDRKISVVAGSIKITATLLKLQSRLITSVITESSYISGIFLKDVVKEFKIPQLLKDISKLVEALLKNSFRFPIENEITFLKSIDEMGKNLEKYRDEMESHRPDIKPGQSLTL